MGIFDKLLGRTPKPGTPREVTDATFEQEVLASALPSVVDFWSSTCPPCHVMGGLLDELGPEFEGRVNFFKLKVTKNPATTARFQIRGVPTIILFHKGKAVDQVVGLLPLNPLRERIENLTDL